MSRKRVAKQLLLQPQLRFRLEVFVLIIDSVQEFEEVALSFSFILSALPEICGVDGFTGSGEFFQDSDCADSALGVVVQLSQGADDVVKLGSLERHGLDKAVAEVLMLRNYSRNSRDNVTSFGKFGEGLGQKRHSEEEDQVVQLDWRKQFDERTLYDEYIVSDRTFIRIRRKRSFLLPETNISTTFATDSWYGL